jgi:hypothetical protein
MIFMTNLLASVLRALPLLVEEESEKGPGVEQGAREKYFWVKIVSPSVEQDGHQADHNAGGDQNEVGDHGASLIWFLGTSYSFSCSIPNGIVSIEYSIWT